MTVPRKGPSTLRLLSFNIHGCVGWGGREDPGATLNVIREADADIVALQEVDDHDEADRSFLRGLEGLGYPEVRYGPTMRKPEGHYGNVLMSRLQVRAIQHSELGIAGLEPRGLVSVLVESNFGALAVLSTHLGLRARERRTQIDRVLALVEAAKRDWKPDGSVLLGDMNEWNPNSRNLRRLKRAFPKYSKMATFPARFPVVALDRILICGGSMQSRFFRLDSPGGRLTSDHRPVLADLTRSATVDARSN